MNNLIWFRNDLRIHDNNSLVRACEGDSVIGVYCFEPKYFKEGDFGFKKTEKYRALFLIETVTRLRENLEKLNIPLFVYWDEAKNRIPDLIQKYTIAQVYLQKEWTRDEMDSLNTVKEKVSNTVSFYESYDQFLFHPTDIPFKAVRQIPEVFTQFRKLCEKNARVRPLTVAPAPMPPANLIKNTTPIPSLSQLGLETFQKDSRSVFPFKGGENSGLGRIQDYFWETKNLSRYKQTRNGMLGTDYSSKLSPWLANGSLSPRKIYWEVKKFEKEVIKNQDTYWLLFELIWRDYFKYISLKHGSRIFQIGGINGGEFIGHASSQILRQWISGKTHESFVNAHMIEIGRTGWMSNRGRQIVASFWSKQLGQDWRIGASYFESMLLDYDVHSNWGNWMYVSGVGNDPRNRSFNIKRQASVYDALGTYQKLWNPSTKGTGIQTSLPL